MTFAMDPEVAAVPGADAPGVPGVVGRDHRPAAERLQLPTATFTTGSRPKRDPRCLLVRHA